MATAKDIEFVGMRSIEKKPTQREVGCTGWIATEKVHGSSFQFYTCDGQIIHMGSRNRCLDNSFTFQRCDLEEFLRRHECSVKRVFYTAQSEDRWKPYRTGQQHVYSEEGDDGENDENSVGEDADYLKNLSLIENSMGDFEDKNLRDFGERGHVVEKNEDKQNDAKSNATNKLDLRIYGELYGGGGVHTDCGQAIQKQIIYCDEIRFYVFGITINRNWVSITELGDLCKDAGFLYYAAPICESRPSLTELKQHLTSSGLMQSRSRLTEREDGYKTKIEGVVMYPLGRPAYGRHAVKLLSEAFTDVKPRGNTGQLNYMTKARYLSVISKLDLPEMQDADLVTSLFIGDIEKESGETLSNNKRKSCFKAVRNWLIKDAYIEDDRDQWKERRLVV